MNLLLFLVFNGVLSLGGFKGGRHTDFKLKFCVFNFVVEIHLFGLSNS